MRVAHLILTYTDSLQTERMINHMYHPDFDFYIHVDKKIDSASCQFLTRIPHDPEIFNMLDEYIREDKSDSKPFEADTQR